MREKPRFEVVKETPYGPQLRRVERTTSLESKDTADVSLGRRAFLKGAATGIGAGAVGIAMHEFGKEDTLHGSGEVEKVEATQEAREGVPPSASFEKELMGYKALTQLAKDEIIFVDEYNVPVGEPIRFQDFIDAKYDDGVVKYEQYRFSPGKSFNEIGIPSEGLVSEWVEYVKKKVQAQHPDRNIAGFHHAYQAIQKAYEESDEPELVARIRKGEITRYIDVVEHFAEKPVVGAEHMTRKEYVQEGIRFASFVPPLVQAELRRLMPGLCAEESRFNAGLVSSSGAEGILQFKPKTWADYNDDPREMLSLVSQTEAAGQHLSDIYAWLIGGKLIPQENLKKILLHFDSVEDFHKDFLVPVMINAYNTGIGTATKWVNAYVEHMTENHTKRGKDLFLDMADFGYKNDTLKEYGEEARKYVTKVYAQAEVLGGEVQYS